jgi:mannosyltransferase
MTSSTTTTASGLRLRSAGASRGTAIAVAALTALALLLRVTSLSRSLFTDEVYSVALAQRSLAHMIGLFGYEANGMAYPLVLWPLIRVLGTSAAVLRVPAVVAGTAGVPALWWAARQLVRERAVALLAAALLAINPMAIWYSQTARPYAFVLLCACLAFGLLPRALASAGGRRAWAGYVAAMVVLAYCNLLAAPIAVPAQALIAARAGRAGVRRWLGALLAVLVYWLPRLSRELVEVGLQEFTGGFSGVEAVRWVTLAAGGALVAAAVWRAWRVSRVSKSTNPSIGAHRHVPLVSGQAPREAWDALAIGACWGLLPGGLLLAVSAVEPVFWPRYAILALPGLCLLGAVAARQLWDSRAGVVLAAGCLVVVAGAAAFADARQVNALQEDWLPIAAWLRAERAPGQPTIVDNALVLPSLGYYDPAFRAPNGELVVQEWHDLPLPAGFVGFKDRTGYGSVPNGPPSVATFMRLARRGNGSVWMVVSEVDTELQGDPRSGSAVAWARRHCHVQARQSVGVWALHATGCTGMVSSGAGRTRI